MKLAEAGIVGGTVSETVGANMFVAVVDGHSLQVDAALGLDIPVGHLDHCLSGGTRVHQCCERREGRAEV